MNDKVYIEYAKSVHMEMIELSSPIVDGIAGRVMTRLRKEYPNLFVRKEEWTKCISNVIDVIDILSVLSSKGIALEKMHKDIDCIVTQFTVERFDEIDNKSHVIVKYRYVGKFGLVDEVKECITKKLKEHYETQRMQNLLQRYPDLKDYSI